MAQTVEFQRRWDALQARVIAQMPPGLTEAQIESKIDRATDEVWADRRAARRQQFLDRLALD